MIDPLDAGVELSVLIKYSISFYKAHLKRRLAEKVVFVFFKRMGRAIIPFLGTIPRTRPIHCYR